MFQNWSAASEMVRKESQLRKIYKNISGFEVRVDTEISFNGAEWYLEGVFTPKS
jgi:hypothetical protein